MRTDKATSHSATLDRAVKPPGPASAPTLGSEGGRAPGRLALIRSIRSLQKLGKTKGRTPTAIIGTILRKWSQDSYPKLPAARLRWSKALSVDPAVITFESYLKRLPLQEAAYWLSTAYTALSPAEYRKHLAMYFTPPPIANRLLDDLADEGALFDRHSFLDPACGGAAFLALLADRMRSALLKRNETPAAILRHAETHLSGIDVDETLCALARHFLRMVFYAEICVAGRAPRFDVENADSLLKYRRLEHRYDVVVCNPPYRKLSREEADVHRAKFAEAMQGQPNLYALFIQLATKLAKVNGIVGLVTPTSFLSGQSFSSLRSFLLNQGAVKHIGFIRARLRVYLDVQQDTALTIIRPGKQAQHERAIAGVSVLDRRGRYTKVGSCPLPNSGSSWPLARDAADIALLQHATKSDSRLADYGYTPMIGAFVWNRDTRPTYLAYDKIPKTRRSDTYPLLWASDLHASGDLRFDRYEASAAQNRYVYVGQCGQTMVKTKPAVLLQRVTASDQERRLVGATVSDRFVSEHRGYVGENHVVILEQSSATPALTPKQMLTLLKTAVVNRCFNCISGCANVSVFELLQLPLPNPHELKRLISGGLSVEQAADKLLLGPWVRRG